jgi:putative phosphoesterase
MFRNAGLQAILHAGDVSVPAVLEQLDEIAPVYAVRGNRDIFTLGSLPLERVMSWNGAAVALTHGHGPWRNYLVDRLHFKLHGYYHERLIPRLLGSFPDVQAIVFGHGHLPLNEYRAGRLLFNPGSPHLPGANGLDPSVGFLHISGSGEISGEVVHLG